MQDEAMTTMQRLRIRMPASGPAGGEMHASRFYGDEASSDWRARAAASF
jgi:hypothetical protein